MSVAVHTISDADTFAAAAAAHIADVIHKAIGGRDSCILGLSGGSTPRDAYTLLGRRTEIDWSKVTVFLIDERLVSSSDARSNAKLVHETLLASANIPASQIVFPDTSLSADTCTEEYDAKLRQLLGASGPDVLVVGMGEDGHIASLFPPVSAEATGKQFALHTTTDHFEVHDRITATFSALSETKEAVFLLKGDSKKQTWEAMLVSDEGIERWPAKFLLERANVSVIAQW